MKSLVPKDFQSLPELNRPAGYILVIRDIDTDRFRIDAAASPSSAIEAVFGETERRFGIELVSILETEDLESSASALYERHHARLSSDWLELDPYQIGGLRRSSLQIDAYASQYIPPDQQTTSGGAAGTGSSSRDYRPAASHHRRSAEAEGFRRAYARPANNRRNVRESLMRYRARNADERRIDWDDPVEAMWQLWERADEYFQTPRGKALKIALCTLVIIICFAIGLAVESAV
ncbi:MAG: hypothetical protein OXG78_07290 [Chloroflexi bacterium]|nr:hypothetical protein [Chloroflexota bacterium]